MLIQVSINHQDFQAKLPGTSIAIPLRFDGAQPNTYGVPKATAEIYAKDGWIGDVRQGGSCNFETYTLTPHCNGTHTECVGHISNPRLSVETEIQDSLVPATLISIQPTSPPADAGYQPTLNPEDRVITEAALAEAMQSVSDEFCQALVLRTLPNDPAKKGQDYMQEPPAFFTHGAMRYLRQRQVRHLLVDFPSVDRLFDEGHLSNHHLFWEVEPGQEDFSEDTRQRSITEMIFVPDHLSDGHYLLNLQLAPFVADAAPSRPILYPLIPKSS